MGEITALISAVALLVGSFKIIEAIIKARASRANGLAANEVKANEGITASWKAATEAQNKNIADIWREIKWLREERELDVEYIDELHAHIDDLRDHILLGKPPSQLPKTPKRRVRRAPPPLTQAPPGVGIDA